MPLPGCNCCGGCTIKICVTACGGLQPGASVEIKSGSIVVTTGTTGSDGCVTFTTVAAGTYTVVVSVSGFGTSTTTQTLECGSGATISLGNSPASGCCCGKCFIPNTGFMLTDALGSYPLTVVPGSSSCAWFACPPVIGGLSGQSLSIDPITGDCVASADSGSLCYSYSVSCNVVTGVITVTRVWPVIIVGTPGTVFFNVNQDASPTGPVLTGCTTCPTAPCEGTGVGFSSPTSGSSLAQLPSSCTPFAWSGMLGTPTIGTDPVGGTVALSS